MEAHVFHHPSLVVLALICEDEINNEFRIMEDAIEASESTQDEMEELYELESMMRIIARQQIRKWVHAYSEKLDYCYSHLRSAPNCFAEAQDIYWNA